MDEVEQYDNVRPEFNQVQLESRDIADTRRYSGTVAEGTAQEIVSNQKNNDLNFETPSERIIRAIRQLDCMCLCFA